MGERYKAVIYPARGSASMPMRVADSAPVYLQRSPNTQSTQPALYGSGNPLAPVPAPISSPAPLQQPPNTQSTQPPYGPDAPLAPVPVPNSGPVPVQRPSNTPYGLRTHLAPGSIPNSAPVPLQSPSNTQSMAPTVCPPCHPIKYSRLPCCSLRLPGHLALCPRVIRASKTVAAQSTRLAPSKPVSFCGPIRQQRTTSGRITISGSRLSWRPRHLCSRVNF